MSAWIDSPSGVDYRGFTHQAALTGQSRHAAIGVERPASLWRTGPETTFQDQRTWGFTHHRFGVSHTRLSGYHTPKHGVSPTNQIIKPLF